MSTPRGYKKDGTKCQPPVTGRPSLYTPALEDKIIELLSNGMSMREICKADEMPSRDTINTWKSTNQAFADRYAQAVEDRAELLSSQIVAIADDLTGDPARDRLRVDARKWIASKLYPHKYGDKVTNDITLKAAVIVQISTIDANI